MFYAHMPIGKVWIYRLLFVCFCYYVCVCMVEDFSAEDKASGVKFCTLVHRRPGQGISHFGELCCLRSPKSAGESANAHLTINRTRRSLEGA